MSAHPQPQPLTADEMERLEELRKMKLMDMTGEELFVLAELRARAKIFSS